MAVAKKTAETEHFWRAFLRTTETPECPYDVVSFADSPKLATQLMELVLCGQKRATAALLRQFGAEGEPLPVIGGHVVLVDGDGNPGAIWRTKELRLGPLVSVDDAFAWDEGEGDRTRAWWIDAHRAFFGRLAEQGGFRMHDHIETGFERFEIVWPPDIADPQFRTLPFSN